MLCRQYVHELACFENLFLEKTSIVKYFTKCILLVEVTEIVLFSVRVYSIDRFPFLYASEKPI